MMYSTQPLLNPLSPNSDQHQYYFSLTLSMYYQEKKVWEVIK